MLLKEYNKTDIRGKEKEREKQKEKERKREKEKIKMGVRHIDVDLISRLLQERCLKSPGITFRKIKPKEDFASNLKIK